MTQWKYKMLTIAFPDSPHGVGIVKFVDGQEVPNWKQYSGPINSDTKMGVAKVHFDHDPQTLHARSESRHRAGTVQGRRDPAADRVPAWRPSQSAAKMESAGVGRSA